MDPVHDRRGQTVGWINKDVVYDLSARPRAFILDAEVYSYRSRHLGRLDKGFFRDPSGRAVAFMRGARGGPIPPVIAIPPIPPIPAIPPIPPIPPIAPIPAIPSLNWSPISWKAFLGE